MTSPVKLDDPPAAALSKLLPAEVTGLFVTVSGLVYAAPIPVEDRWCWLVPSIVVISALGFVYLGRALSIVNTNHKLIYTVSFLLWAVTLNVDALFPDEYFSSYQLLLSIASVLWAFTLPLIVPRTALVGGRP